MANPEKVKHNAHKNYRAYKERHPFRNAIKISHCSALKYRVLSTLTEQEWQKIAEDAKFICHICGRKAEVGWVAHPRALRLAHIVPLSRGGTNTKDNVLPACALCNQSKTNMLMAEFQDWIKIVFNNFKK